MDRQRGKRRIKVEGVVEYENRQCQPCLCTCVSIHPCRAYNDVHVQVCIHVHISGGGVMPPTD